MSRETKVAKSRAANVISAGQSSWLGPTLVIIVVAIAIVGLACAVRSGEETKRTTQEPRQSSNDQIAPALGTRFTGTPGIFATR